MESRIPIPTDNIFKFCALFAMVVFFSSFGGLLYQTDKTNGVIFSTYVELATLSEQAKPSASAEAKKQVLERKLEIALADRTFYIWFLAATAGASFWLAIYGFMRWHKHVQPMLDEAQRVQIEIAKLNLTKLEIEVERLRKEG
jgi:hypothetical protein